MKKKLMLMGVLTISLLFMSSVTAVPKTNSEPVMDLLDEINNKKMILKEIFSLTEIDIKNILLNKLPTGIIDFLIQIITFFINLMSFIIDFIQTVMSLGNLLAALIDAVYALLEAISTFIEWLRNLFTPDYTF